MAITALPATPNRATDNAAAFSSKADALLGALAGFVAEANAQAAAMNSLAAGGAMTIPYTFDTTTADADPGAGKLRLGNATQNLAVVMRLDSLGADGIAWSGVIDTFDDSSSVIKGFILLQSVTDASKWLLFTTTAVASPAGYKNLTVSHVAGSAASPFVDGESLVLKFTRNGDKGDVGAAGLSTPLAVLTPTAVANVDALSVFSATYDNYLVLGTGLKPSAADTLFMRLAVGGVTDTAPNYNSGSSPVAFMNISVSGVLNTGKGVNFWANIMNVNDAATIKSVVGRANCQTDATPTYSSGPFASNYTAASVVTGLRLFWQSGANFAAQGKVRIYGYNNS